MSSLFRPMTSALAALVLIYCSNSSQAETALTKTFTYSAKSHKAGELKFENNIPVLRVSGTPEEIGEQIGVLAIRPAKELLRFPDELLKKRKLEHLRPVLVQAGIVMLPRFPDDHLAEMEAMAHWGEVDEELLTLVNTVDDLERIGGCSSLTVLSENSTTGGPLVARNLDYDVPEYVPHYSLVTIYHPRDKLSFASIGFPGFVGVLSGMNEAGLVLVTHEIRTSADGSPTFSADGVPMTLSFRRIMEECKTIGEAEELLRSVKRTTYLSITVCDTKDAAVLELTPKNVVARHIENGKLVCTNHFRSPELRTSLKCWRYDALTEADSSTKFDLPKIWKRLHQASWRGTLQSMVFEPAPLKLHLSYGPLPATSQPPKVIELAELLVKE